MVSDNLVIISLAIIVNYWFVRGKNKFLSGVLLVMTGLGSLIPFVSTNYVAFSLIIIIAGMFATMRAFYE